MLKDKNLVNIFTACVLFTLGVLFCCSLAIGISGLSIIIGIALILLGTVLAVSTFLKTNNILNINGLYSSVFVSLGIVFISYELAGIVFLFIPWFLIVFGVIVLIDALYGKLKNTNTNLTSFVVKLIVAVVSITLGICLVTIKGFMEYASIVLGILLIVYSIYHLFFKNRYDV